MEIISSIVNSIGLQYALFLAHLIPFFIALRIWSKKHINRSFKTIVYDLVGYVSVPISLIFGLIFLDVGSPGGATGDHSGWFLIFSVVTFGFLPFLTMTFYFCSGRMAGRFIHKYRRKA